ncbi:MAG: helix-turn-helix domain-containing protein [Coriobacteriales bacterium]|nr:helix-turn-helix domain-containing protein [Coriobacteriales bacterium]
MGPVIAIGANICRLRKESHLTQGDLARHLGVTKASVSKWETGQSYPDVELLPRIAAFFDVTVDALMGYEPQMSKEGIRRECARLREAFASMPFDEAHAQCTKLVHDYYSCYPLLVQIAVLYLNHLGLVDGAKRGELAREAVELCRRVRRGSSISTDVRLAEAVEASLELAAGDPQAAIEALGDVPDIDLGADMLLASAYGALGQADEADKILQGALFQALVLSLNRLAQMAALYTGKPAKIGIAYERAQAIIEAFDMESVYANTAAIHLSFAMAYMMCGDSARALDCLDGYVRAARALSFPLELHGDDFFDKTQSWLDDVNGIGTSVPRDDALVRKSLVESVAANPAFVPLSDEPRFKRVVASLQEVVR